MHNGMITRLSTTLFLLVVTLAGCSPAVPHWKEEARISLDSVRKEGAEKLFPDEFNNAMETLIRGDLFLHREEIEDAEKLFRLALVKGNLLGHNLALEKQRREEESRLKAESEQRELERKRKELEEPQRLTTDKSEGEVQIKTEKPRQPKDRPLLAYHTVKRGETLPQISAQVEVYNDSNLWPLLYRANRDQISDPRHLWPGQVLRIPRNLSRDETAEARRYAIDKRFR